MLFLHLINWIGNSVPLIYETGFGETKEEQVFMNSLIRSNTRDGQRGKNDKGNPQIKTN